MEVYILRHGVAVPRESQGLTDEERPLTPSGISKMVKAAKGMVQVVSSPDVILTSPLKRAQETAEIVAKTLKCRDDVQAFEPLKPGIPVKELMAALAEFNDHQSVMLVGHEPQLGSLASALLGLRRTVVEIKKGALCCIDLPRFPPRRSGVMKWLLTSRQLRRIR